MTFTQGNEANEARTSGLRLRIPLPSCVVMLALSRSMKVAVRDALPGRVAVSDVSSTRECADVLQTEVGACVLVRVPAALEDAQGERLLQLREQFPNTSFIALVGEHDSDSRWVVRLAKAGVSELVVCRRNVPSQTLLAALSRCETDTIAVRVWSRAGLEVSDALKAVLKPAIRLAHAPISLQRLASATRLHERSLRKYCARHKLPSPSWIIGWARLLLAAYYLEEAGRTIQNVVDLLQFPSAVVFSNTARRYTGKTPSQLRQAGPVGIVSRLLEAALMPGALELVEGNRRTTRELDRVR